MEDIETCYNRQKFPTWVDEALARQNIFVSQKDRFRIESCSDSNGNCCLGLYWDEKLEAFLYNDVSPHLIDEVVIFQKELILKFLNLQSGCGKRMTKPSSGSYFAPKEDALSEA